MRVIVGEPQRAAQHLANDIPNDITMESTPTDLTILDNFVCNGTLKFTVNGKIIVASGKTARFEP